MGIGHCGAILVQNFALELHCCYIEQNLFKARRLDEQTKNPEEQQKIVQRENKTDIQKSTSKWDNNYVHRHRQQAVSSGNMKKPMKCVHFAVSVSTVYISNEMLIHCKKKKDFRSQSDIMVLLEDFILIETSIQRNVAVYTAILLRYYCCKS